MPLTDRSQAKESGFAQVREALVSFEGDVVAAEFGQWGGQMVDEQGNKLKPREFLEISNVNVTVLEVTEELAMPIEEWNFRINCSDYKGSFWVDYFLASADEKKVMIPDGLIGKRIIWKKATMSFTNRAGQEVSHSNFVIAGIKGQASAPKIVQAQPSPAPAQPKVTSAQPAEEVASAPAPDVDEMEVAANLANGKTELQFRSAAALDPVLKNSDLLPLAKAGLLTQALLTEGKIVKVEQNGKTIYQKA